MSSGTRTIVILIVIVVAVVAVWKYSQHNNTQPTPLQQQDTPLSAGTSNKDLESDLSTIDADLQATDTASIDIDQGLNDQPIAQ
jgi:peptidoglycan hydrolase CwlO-like protein